MEVMATKQIPARTEVSCDRCGVDCTNANRRMAGVLSLYRHGTDYQGNAVGPAGCTYELCDKCIMEAESVVEKLLIRRTELEVLAALDAVSELQDRIA